MLIVFLCRRLGYMQTGETLTADSECHDPLAPKKILMCESHREDAYGTFIKESKRSYQYTS